MKNHEWVNGKLLQTNKKYSQLKLKQKENMDVYDRGIRYRVIGRM